MYGICEILCRLLGELYPAETPLNLIIWSLTDTGALAGGVEYAISEQDTRAVLARTDAIPEEQRFESSASVSAVMDPVEQVKEAASGVAVSVELLEALLITTEQALWHREWTARDENHPVPKSIARRLVDATKIRASLKKWSLRAARVACTDPIQRNPLCRKPPR